MADMKKAGTGSASGAAAKGAAKIAAAKSASKPRTASAGTTKGGYAYAKGGPVKGKSK